MSSHPLHRPVIGWYRAHGRDLPWRQDSATPWGIVVSEVMLQQTPVARVLPVWQQWLERWPTPAALAAEPAGEAIRAWGRLGYPRRALRLHAAATTIVACHGGQVPSDHADLLALPGFGQYTAAAVASFAFGQRHVVLDTNVRRVFARALNGKPYAPTHPTAAETAQAAQLLPASAARAATWAVATMELGALICTAAATPACAQCPVRSQCRWRAEGYPPPTADEPVRRGQAWHGTDRQIRGFLLAALRSAHHPLPVSELLAAVPAGVARDPHQPQRCLDSLVTDGLAEPDPHGHIHLPH